MSEERFDRYPGFRPFEEKESFLFFGRDQELNELVNSIKAFNLFILHGKSGLGKTSLINAGLLPLLKRESFHPIQIPFRLTSLVGQVNLGSGEVVSNPMKVISNAFKNFIDEELLQNFSEDEKTLWFYVKALRDRSSIPVLICDQFEEFFSYPDKNVKISIMQQIAELISEKTPSYVYESCQKLFTESNDDLSYFLSPCRVRILITIKSDRLNLLDDMIPYIPGITNKRFKLNSLTREQVKEAVLFPAGLIAHSGKSFSSHSFQYNADALEDILSVLFNKQSEGSEGGSRNEKENEITINTSVETENGKEDIEASEIESTQLQVLCMTIEKGFFVEENKLEDKSTTMLDSSVGVEKERTEEYKKTGSQEGNVDNNDLLAESTGSSVSQSDVQVECTGDGNISISLEGSLLTAEPAFLSTMESERKVTSETFDGKKGLRKILQNFYDDQLMRLVAETGATPYDIERVRALIERKMIYNGMRIGLLGKQVWDELGDMDSRLTDKERKEKVRVIVKELESLRLIREEESYLGKTYVISHDALIKPILKSSKYNKQRKEREARIIYENCLKSIDSQQYSAVQKKAIKDFLETDMIREGRRIQMNKKEVLFKLKDIGDKEAGYMLDIFTRHQLLIITYSKDGEAYEIANHYLQDYILEKYQIRKAKEEYKQLQHNNRKLKRRSNVALIGLLLFITTAAYVFYLLKESNQSKKEFRQLAADLYLAKGKETYNNYDNFIAYNLFDKSRDLVGEGEPTEELKKFNDEILAGLRLDVSPASDIVNLTKDSTMYHWKYNNGRLNLVNGKGLKNVISYFVTYDKRKIFLARKGIDSTLVIYDLGEGKITGKSPVPVDKSVYASYSNSGDVIVLRDKNSRLRIYKNENGSFRLDSNNYPAELEKQSVISLEQTYRKKKRPFEISKDKDELHFYVTDDGKKLVYKVPLFIWDYENSDYAQDGKYDIYVFDLENAGYPDLLANSSIPVYMGVIRKPTSGEGLSDSLVIIKEKNIVSVRNLYSDNIRKPLYILDDSLVDKDNPVVDFTNNNKYLVATKNTSFGDKVSIIDLSSGQVIFQRFGRKEYLDNRAMIYSDSLENRYRVLYADLLPLLFKADSSFSKGSITWINLDFYYYMNNDTFFLRNAAKDYREVISTLEQGRMSKPTITEPFLIIRKRHITSSEYKSQLRFTDPQKVDLRKLYPGLPYDEKKKYFIKD